MQNILYYIYFFFYSNYFFFFTILILFFYSRIFACTNSAIYYQSFVSASNSVSFLPSVTLLFSNLIPLLLCSFFYLFLLFLVLLTRFFTRLLNWLVCIIRYYAYIYFHLSFFLFSVFYFQDLFQLLCLLTLWILY